jgi:hypothetical protein
MFHGSKGGKSISHKANSLHNDHVLVESFVKKKNAYALLKLVVF